MWSIIREGLTYFSFVLILDALTYSDQNTDVFHQVNHWRKFLPNTRQPENSFDSNLRVVATELFSSSLVVS